MDYLEIESVERGVRVTCDRMNAQCIRQELARHGISGTPENDLVCSHETYPSKNSQLDLVEFYVESREYSEVASALRDMIKLVRQHPR